MSNAEFISLFAGAGGLDIGLESAGWQCAYASDIDAMSVKTLRANQGHRAPSGTHKFFDDTFLEQSDVTKTNGKDILSKIGRRRGDIPLLAGGPPCQSWSSAGHQLGFNDPRGQLWSDFARLAVDLDVRWLLFENVRGLLTARGVDGVPGSALATIRAKLLEVGFQTTVSLLNAADYGIPQRRVRLFVIGFRSGDIPSFPEATHSKAGSLFMDSALNPWVPMKNYLLDADELHRDELLRPSGKMAQDLIGIEPGSGVKSMGKRERTRPSGHWGYKQGAFVADPEMPARTITASGQQDWIIDSKVGLRRLCPRECAAIQTFPNNYRFEGAFNAKYRHIGNAVPPKLAAAIGGHLRAQIHALDESRSVKLNEPLPLPKSLENAISYTKREEASNGASRRLAPVRKRVSIARRLADA